jgi:hypothetical protein
LTHFIGGLSRDSQKWINDQCWGEIVKGNDRYIVGNPESSVAQGPKSSNSNEIIGGE